MKHKNVIQNNKHICFQEKAHPIGYYPSDFMSERKKKRKARSLMFFQRQAGSGKLNLKENAVLTDRIPTGEDIFLSPAR